MIIIYFIIDCIRSVHRTDVVLLGYCCLLLSLYLHVSGDNLCSVTEISLPPECDGGGVKCGNLNISRLQQDALDQVCARVCIYIYIYVCVCVNKTHTSICVKRNAEQIV